MFYWDQKLYREKLHIQTFNIIIKAKLTPIFYGLGVLFPILENSCNFPHAKMSLTTTYLFYIVKASKYSQIPNNLAYFSFFFKFQWK